MDATEIKRWLDTLGPGALVAIDKGGLSLIEVDSDNRPTGAFLEIGGADD